MLKSRDSMTKFNHSTTRLRDSTTKTNDSAMKLKDSIMRFNHLTTSMNDLAMRPKDLMTRLRGSITSTKIPGASELGERSPIAGGHKGCPVIGMGVLGAVQKVELSLPEGIAATLMGQ